MISVRHLYSLEDLTEINVSPIKVTGELCDEEGISFLLRTYTSRILKVPILRLFIELGLID
jgi:hypothetical protein